MYACMDGMHAYMHVWVHAYMHVWEHACHTYECTHVWMPCMHTCMYGCMHTSMDVNNRIHTCIYIHTYRPMCACVCVYAWVGGMHLGLHGWHAYIHVWVLACTHAHIMDAPLHTYIHACMHASMDACVAWCMCACMLGCMHAHIHGCMDGSLDVCMHA